MVGRYFSALKWPPGLMILEGAEREVQPVSKTLSRLSFKGTCRAQFGGQDVIDTAFKSLDKRNHSSASLQIIGFVFALVAVVLATFFASTEASSFNAGSKDDESLDYPPDFFHLVYVLASAYVAMLFISWNLGDVPGKLVVDKGWISVWFHMATQWLSFLVYTWILLAPRLLSGREFV